MATLDGRRGVLDADGTAIVIHAGRMTTRPTRQEQRRAWRAAW
jgi:hypothetical protein